MYMENSIPSVYLASKSPRRQDILRAAGIPFELLAVDVEETFPDDMPVEEVPEYLARKKAEAAILLTHDDHVVLTADSIVILDNVIFGKPADQEEAMKMLRLLSGRHHLVITGVFIGNRKKAISFSSYTSVWMEPMTDEEIAFYISHYQPFDKAGSYGIQDWLGWTKISRIEGSYANVMGLPIDQIYKELKEWHT